MIWEIIRNFFVKGDYLLYGLILNVCLGVVYLFKWDIFDFVSKDRLSYE